MSRPKPDEQNKPTATTADKDEPPANKPDQPKEIGGRPGPEPTRFGDWEKGGRCIDF
jgi:hypothetical protein